MKVVLKSVRYLLLFFSLCCYLSVLIPPGAVPFAVVLGYCIPGIIFLNLLFFIFFLFRKGRKILLPTLGLIASIPFLLASFQWSSANEAKEDSFTVMNFNAKLFRRPGSYREFSMEMIEWTAEDPSDIKVIPEHSTDNRWEPLDVNKRIGSRGYSVFSVAAPIKDNEHNLGSAIFSRFPTTAGNSLFTDSSSIAMTIYQDVAVGNKTVRIYAVHLASMGLEKVSGGGILSKFKQICEKLMAGAVNRSHQVDMITKHLETCEYPFILSGDFNETPYSYNYWKLRRYAKDAFVDEGNGLGFTFNSALPVARIDYQFVSDGIVVEKLEVDKQMILSDHLPVRGTYRLSK